MKKKRGEDLPTKEASAPVSNQARAWPGSGKKIGDHEVED